MDCDYWPVDEERMSREFEEGVARRQLEIKARLERVEQRWEESEKARRREWEALEGRLMTAYEENRHYSDGLLRRNVVMTQEFIAILREGREVARAEAAENRAETRANTEAVLKLLDRLSPPRTE
jgi:hypothetical protein